MSMVFNVYIETEDATDIGGNLKLEYYEMNQL